MESHKTLRSSCNGMGGRRGGARAAGWMDGSATGWARRKGTKLGDGVPLCFSTRLQASLGSTY